MLNQYYAQSLACSAGSTPCAWQLVESTLPAGVSFDPVAGVVLGTPSRVETGLVTVSAYDPAWPANVTTATLSLTIAPPPFTVSIPPAAVGQVGSAYQLVSSVTGTLGSATWSIVSGTLPAGLTVDPQTGVIAGVPSSWGTTTAVVQAQDSWRIDRVDAKPVTITILPVLTVALSAPSSGQVGVPYAGTALAAGVVGAPAWSIAAGALPPGVVLDAASGAIGGVPTTDGAFSAVVQVRDSSDPSRVSAVTLNIAVAPSSTEIVLYAADATVVNGTWVRMADATAAGGSSLWNKDLAAAKLATALASPVNYFELTFNAQAGVPYHLWMRGKADKNNWANDSVWVQFSGSVNVNGGAQYRIGTTAGTFYSVEDGTNAGVAGWGWNDDDYNGLAAPIYFAATGPQTIRIQVREDGLALDQIVLSANRYLNTSPGAFKNDTTILPR